MVFVSTVLLSGCWSQKELTDIALVSALGIDKSEEGNYVVTFQIINPGNVAAGKQGTGQSSPPVTVFTSSGDNIVEASKRATKNVSRRLYYAHTNLLVISEQLAKEEGINHLFDALERDPEFRTTTTVVIANNSTAGDIVKTLTQIEKVPANKVIKTLKFSEKRWGEFINVNTQEVIKGLVSPGKEPVISGYTLFGNPEIGKKLENTQQTLSDAMLEANGMAVFKDGMLIDWFHGETARGATFILDKITATAVNIDWKGKEQAIAYEMVRQKTKVSALKVKQGLPIISIVVKAEGDIGEVTVPINLSDPKVLLEIEDVIEKEIKKEIQLSVQRAQKHKSDILGFGEVVHLEDPKAWKRLKHDWNDVHFPKLKVNVKVEAFIRRTGLRNKPYLFNMENNE